MLMNRKLRLPYDIFRPTVAINHMKNITMENKFSKQHGAKLRFFKPGDRVIVTMYNGKLTWKHGTIWKRRGKVIYEVLVDNHIIIRHANQIRKRVNSNTDKHKLEDELFDVLLDTFSLPKPAAAVQNINPKDAIPRTVQSTKANLWNICSWTESQNITHSFKGGGVLWANNHTSIQYLHIWLYWLSNITTRQISHTSQSILLALLTCSHAHFDSTMWIPLTRLMWIDFLLTHLAHLSTIQLYHVIFQIIDFILILRLIRIKSVFPFGLLQSIAGR